MNILFVSEARAEFLDAIFSNEEARKGGGQRFKDEVDRILWMVDQ